MGPTNIALVKLFQADQALREAQGRLDSASRSVRVQERRLADLNEKLRLAQSQLREQQTQGSSLELDVKSRDAKIEKLRNQQQNSKNHKEYQAFLTEINTEKIDKAKIEDELLKVMEAVEKSQGEIKELTAQIEGEQKKYDETKQQLGGKLAALQADVDKLAPVRQAAAQGLPAPLVETFDRLAERFEGEALAPIAKPNKRREEYICGACHMDLVADIYNRLHSRDDLLPCPNCRRILYIPDDLPPEQALNTRPSRKPAAAAAGQEEASE